MNNSSAYAKEQKIYFKGPVGRLEGYLYNSKHNLIGVICHPHPLHQGTMNNKVVTTIAKAWQELGLSTVRFNFRGVGESEGTYGHGTGEIEDLLAVLKELQEKFPNAHFWLAGFSFGSFISLSVAAKNSQNGKIHQNDQDQQNHFPINALLTVAPPVHHFDFLKLETLPSCPWLIIQGLLDSIVPVKDVLEWAKTMQEKAELIEQDNQETVDKQKDKWIKLITLSNAEHFFHGQLIELKNTIVENMKLL